MNNINWNNVDWSKRTVDIAQQLGVSPGNVSYHRNEMHKRKEKRGKYRIDWSKVDWTKPNYVIGSEINASPSAVIIARKIHAPENLKRGRDVKGAHAKAHLRDHFKGKKYVKRQPKRVPTEQDHRLAMRNAAVIYTADQIQQHNGRVATDASKGIGPCVQGGPLQSPIAAIQHPVQRQAQPSWVKRKLIAIRDWLFNLCVSVEKEANK
jgi:hypothetical protein